VVSETRDAEPNGASGEPSTLVRGHQPDQIDAVAGFVKHIGRSLPSKYQSLRTSAEQDHLTATVAAAR
jgi:hypothetical protein